MSRAAFVFVAVLMIPVSAHAQLVVTDPAVTFRQAMTAAVKQLVIRVTTHYADFMDKWSQRLLTNYAMPEPPRWRTWRQYDPMPESLAFMNGLNGEGRLRRDAVLTVERLEPDGESLLPPSVMSSLALLDATDSSLLVAVEQTGAIRGARRKERAALEALDSDVADGSGSTSARLGLLSGAALVHTRQAEARGQLTERVVEQLTVDTLRDRQTETAAMALRLELLTARPATTGAADALRDWRQP